MLHTDHNYTSVLKILLVALLCVQQCEETKGLTIQEQYYVLLTDLFTGYQPEVRPTTNGSATIVYLDFSLNSIQNLDEKNQVLETSVILTIQWVDAWLAWNSSVFGDIESLRYPQSKLWLPDVVVLNLVESQTQLGYKEMPLRIYSDGTVIWQTTEILHTSCDMDITYYPFDKQHCSIILTTWVSSSTEISLDIKSGYNSSSFVDLSKYSKSGTWQLLDTEVIDLPDEGGETKIEYTFTLKRLRTYYVVNIILPVIFLSFTASTVFYLPADAGEKMGMSITVLLAFAVYLTIISDNMPQTSLQTSILSVYLTMLLAVTANAVLLSVFVLNMHHRPADRKVGKRVAMVTTKVREALRLHDDDDNSDDEDTKAYKTTSPNPTALGTKAANENDLDNSQNIQDKSKLRLAFSRSNTEIKKLKRKAVTWQTVARTVDSVCFTAYSIFIALLTIISMGILMVGE